MREGGDSRSTTEKRSQIVIEEEGVATRMISTQERRTKKQGGQRERGVRVRVIRVEGRP